MSPALRQQIEYLLGARIRRCVALSGGCIGDVQRVEAMDGRSFVLKLGGRIARQGPGLPAPSPWTEAHMLKCLSEVEGVPLPDVIHAEKAFILMAFIETRPVADTVAVTRDLADIVARLHSVKMPRYGFDRPTPIGSIQRKNPWTESWITFFRDCRLMPIARMAAQSGRLPEGCLSRLEVLCGRLEDWLPEYGRASLIHGDLWAGNILLSERKVAALIDPAVFYADPEYELAFMPLFGGFGPDFMPRYREHHAVPPEFESERLPLYQIEPLLVHAALFGGSYGTRADAVIRRYVA